MTARIYIYDTQGQNELVCSLTPEPSGADDGGRDYTLPKGYTLQEGQFSAPNGSTCYLQMHNGAPLLVDNANKLAFLLEQERKMEQRRKAAGLTRLQLADQVGLTQYDIYRMEHHEVEPSTAALGKIAAVLHCDTIDLI